MAAASKHQDQGLPDERSPQLPDFAAMPKEGNVLCDMCGQTFPQSKCCVISAAGHKGQKQTIGRCDECNSTRSRVYRMIQTRGIQGFDDVTGENKAAFMAKASTLYGDKLAKLIVETITQVRTQKQITQFQATGGFIDWDDAKEKYAKTKPDQWESIKQHGTRFTCPTRGVLMVSIPTYALTNTQEDSNVLETKRKIEREETIKKQKVIKREKITVPETGDQPKELSTAQIKRVETLKEKIDS